MTIVATHTGTASVAFDVVHRGQVVSFPAGALMVDPLMRATIDASDAEVVWDDDPVEPAGEGEVQRPRRGRLPNRV